MSPPPIYYAVQADNLGVVKLLIDAGAKLNDRDIAAACGGSVLWDAAAHGSVEVVQMLLGAGADPRGQIDDPLKAAARFNRPENVRALIKAGADTEAEGGFTTVTPLMEAASVGALESLKALIECGAQVNARSSNGMTALMLAAHNGSNDCIAVLINAGANARARTLEGYTAFDYAAAHQHLIGTDVYWHLNDARF